VNYLLDTNACIALINGKPLNVRQKFEKAVNRGSIVHVSSIAAFELWYGAEKSERKEANMIRMRTFLTGPISPLSFDGEDARIAGAIRAELELAGRPIGAYDLLMAAQAIRHKLTLVTSNAREFKRVSGLSWEDWAKTSA
jgi:tRNA(fMet)-specific endonuclease VapC